VRRHPDGNLAPSGHAPGHPVQTPGLERKAMQRAFSVKNQWGTQMPGIKARCSFAARCRSGATGLLWRPKIGTLQMIALPPQSTRCRFGNTPPSASCTSQHARDTGRIKVATVTQVHDGTHKIIYNITAKTPRVKNPNIHTKIQIIHKAK
jgi:hypothetical protein